MTSKERELRKYLGFLRSITEGPEGEEKKSSHTIAMKKITALVRAVREDEREKCAKVAESEELSGMDSTSANHALEIAAAIRGKK